MVSHFEELVSLRASELFADLLGLSPKEVEVRREPSSRGDWGADLAVDAAGLTFLLEALGASSAGRIFDKAKRIVKHASARTIPVIVVPFMGEAGKAACERVGVSWLDLSGNAHIVGPGLRVLLDGRPNQFRKRGRPANVFAPKSSRVARYLLMHPRGRWTQRQISHATGVSEGLVSRIVARLEKEHYLVRDDRGLVELKEPEVMLEAWKEQYQFSRHTIVKGHVAARSGTALSQIISDTLKAEGLEHAATGLAAAWQFTQFSIFRMATYYVGGVPSPKTIERMGFLEGDKGANSWLVVPNDSGVFQGAEVREGIRCVHPVQVYLDLQEHPERSAEAAERLRSEFLNEW